MTEPRPILFSDRGCPFAHRVLSFAAHLGCALDHREARIGEHPPGLGRYSRSGRIPLLVDGELVLTESRVILEYLAERHACANAYPGDLAARTLHRHAIAVADEHLVPRLLERTPSVPGDPRVEDVLDAIEVATATTPPKPCLLAFHLGPLWLAFGTWQPHGAVTRAIEARPALRAWLDAAAALPDVARTAPDPERLAQDLMCARAAGLLPAIDAR